MKEKTGNYYYRNLTYQNFKVLYKVGHENLEISIIQKC